MLIRALLAVAVVVGGGLPLVAAAPLASQAPGPSPNCPPPAPDRVGAPTADSPPLAVAPFRLDASRVELHQVDLLHSNKVVSVRTRQGSKRVLQLVAGAVDVTDLRQTTTADGTASLTLSTPPGSRTRLGGPVVMYVEKLCGTLALGPLGIGFGVPGALLPPISPASPPPAVLPELTFTGVSSYLAGLSSITLNLPDALLSAGASQTGQMEWQEGAGV